MDEVSYVNALLWHMQRPPATMSSSPAVGYSSAAARVFLRVAPVFADAWTARIWFEFGRIDPVTELTPILACHWGMVDRIDAALAKYLSAPLPAPEDSGDLDALGRWLDGGGAFPSS
ncbi:MAG: hypothetical protein ABS98_06415 [Lysobacteraceae bacterium SCN 69-48]|nr:MAG: hypothetical protein ABS98_06415 [Xanthomonadaceae bacterium SCN 69-48]